MINKQDAVEMVNLMLNDGRQKRLRLNRHRRAVFIVRLDADFRGADDIGGMKNAIMYYSILLTIVGILIAIFLVDCKMKLDT